MADDAKTLLSPYFLFSLLDEARNLLILTLGQTGCLSWHQGFVGSTVAEPNRPAIGRWWRCSLFHSCIAWNGNKLRCQAAVRLTAANKALASSESSQSVPSLPLLLLLLLPPYNAIVTPWLCDCFLSFAVAQRIRSECGLSIRRAKGLQRS